MPELIGRSPAWREVMALLPRAAASGLPVLVQGETGTGKELVARAIHHLSPRRGTAFVAHNCGVDFGIDPVDDLAHVFRVICKVQIIDIDDEEFALLIC
jgi:sigma54-dependent transcription regulator